MRDGGEPAETLKGRGRRKFASGALEQAAHILGAIAASVLVVGLVGPYIAALAGPMHAPGSAFLEVAALALGIAGLAAMGSVVLRGLSRAADDDQCASRRAAARKDRP